MSAQDWPRADRAVTWAAMTDPARAHPRQDALAARPAYRWCPEVLLADALAVVLAHDRVDRPFAAALAQEGAAALTAGPPDPSLGAGVQAEADLWADLASAAELAAYLRAILARLPSAPQASRARKRLFADLWAALEPADRRAFLQRADPGGRLRERAVS